MVRHAIRDGLVELWPLGVADCEGQADRKGFQRFAIASISGSPRAAYSQLAIGGRFVATAGRLC
jgi:hypothetical protein